MLSARPYAFLDDAPLEERRTQAVLSRRWLDPTSAADIGRLDAEAIRRVREEAWPDARSADELHDALSWIGFLADAEIRANPAWPALLAELVAQRRVEQVRTATGQELWIAVERRTLFAQEWRDAALVEILRGRLEGSGPVTAESLTDLLGLPRAQVDAALLALQAEGFAMQGRFSPDAAQDEWVERRLLARIHRYTVKRLRAEIEPVQARDFLRFLFEWQRVLADARMHGPDAVAAVVTQLEAFEAPAGAWETEILPARIAGYEPEWLDEHCLAGRFAWRRLAARAADRERGAAPVRTTPVVLLPRRTSRIWSGFAVTPDMVELTSSAQEIARSIAEHGASFFDDLVENTSLLPSQVEDALGELVALGLVNSDSFGGLRALLLPADRRRGASGPRRRRTALFGMADAGRWTLTTRTVPRDSAREADNEGVEHVVHTLLAPLGRDLLGTARARGGVAAAVARVARLLPPTGGARGGSRGTVRRGILGRAVCDARGRRVAARGAPARPRTGRRSRCRPPTRSTSWGS